MRAIDELELSYAQIDLPKIERATSLFERLERNKLLLIIVIAAIGFCARVYRLDAAGLAEDETNKIFAIRAYEQGDFTANAEHPMLMKTLCYASLHLASALNETVGAKLGLALTEETALRFPNATFGALTVIPLFLLTSSLLGFRVGCITAVLWSLGLDAIWFNRVAKEDTLLVFFMLCGFYLYHHAKQLPAFDNGGQQRLYALAGAAFGFMMASKYFPHYFGLNALFYTIVGYDSRNNRPLTRAMWARYFAALLFAFAVFNPALSFPQTWRYLWKYVNEELLTHHGYLVMGKLFVNDFMQTPGGNPWYFYFLFLVVKLPLPILIAFIIGFVEIFRRRGKYPDSRGYLFLRLMLVFWLLPQTFVGVKFLRYTLSLLPLLYMAASIGIVISWRVVSSFIEKIVTTRRVARMTAAFVVAAAFIVAPSIETIGSILHSYPSLFVNVIGRNHIGYFFPHDEFYDLGARESVRFIADTAAPGSMMASEVPGVVEYYLEHFNRADIRSEIISQPSFSLSEGKRPSFVLIQPGRVYFENVDDLNLIERAFPLVQASVHEGATTAAVYATGH